jgi:hypothetical protein
LKNYSATKSRFGLWLAVINLEFKV